MLEQLGRTETPAKIAERKLRESELIALVSALVRELHPQRVRFIDVQPSKLSRPVPLVRIGYTCSVSKSVATTLSDRSTPRTSPLSVTS